VSLSGASFAIHASQDTVRCWCDLQPAGPQLEASTLFPMFGSYKIYSSIFRLEHVVTSFPECCARGGGGGGVPINTALGSDIGNVDRLELPHDQLRATLEVVTNCTRGRICHHSFQQIWL
jgi:hypothetical protein